MHKQLLVRIVSGSILFLIFLLALVLRVIYLDSAPRGALIDEAHFGYLAKSLLETGRDEHGNAWPIIFKGFGDQKLPMYAYLLILFVKVLDLSVLSIRLPSALMGALSVVLLYWFIRAHGFGASVSRATALVMAVSPWPFFLSRFGFESNAALFFWLIGLVALTVIIRSTKDDSRWWQSPLVCGTAFAATWYSYIAYRPVTALLLLALLATHFFVPHIRKQMLIATAVMTALIVPLFLPSASQAHTARLQQVGLLSGSGTVQMINEYRTFCDTRLPLAVCSLVWNKGGYAYQTVAARFLQTFSPQYLATEGEIHEQFLTVKGYGQFSPAVYIFFLLGLVSLAKMKRVDSTRWLLIFGLVISPMPAIWAGDPQKVRLSPLLPFVLLLVAYGLRSSLVHLRQLERNNFIAKGMTYVAGGLMAALFVFTTSSYYFDYFTVHTVKNDHMYQSYVRTIMPVLKNKYADYDVVVKPFFSDPTMFYAFYNNMNPYEYQRQAVLGPLENSGFQHTIAIDAMRVSDRDEFDIFCQAAVASSKTVYLTNTQVAHGYVLEKATSENGVLTHAYLYDAGITGKVNVQKCQMLPQSMRDQVYQEAVQSGLVELVLSQGS